ncbi:MAG: hypothetical protein NWT00_00660, partial [Beijerinckiaceae bacterium]|nr:hypothetical protein [Beijerinckiaceae bacterium]
SGLAGILPSTATRVHRLYGDHVRLLQHATNSAAISASYTIKKKIAGIACFLHRIFTLIKLNGSAILLICDSRAWYEDFAC